MSTLNGPFDEMEMVNTLLADANERGYMTYDQILEALPEAENNLPLLEMVMEELQAAGISIYESEEDAEAAEESGENLNGSGDDYEDAPHAAPLFDLSNVPIDDSVGLYFREMGQQSLLTAEEEVQLAKEIEAGNEAVERLTELNESGKEVDLDEVDELVRLREVGDA
ncbi:MAG: sigma-70 factor domain-containing protein, partial [Candidatus Promineifilaceae bacterium]|nr:sigma-70 factor domain-containing protein [Candidatus Promineifilaceae bacterium]